MSDPWIQTHTGLRFSPLGHQPADFDIRDQIAALSKLARYTGHTNTFYSVAEHAVRVSERVEAEASNNGLGELETLNQARLALVHDNTEAYLADVVRPLKGHPTFRGYCAAEADLFYDLRKWLGLLDVDGTVTSLVDRDIIGLEARQLFRHRHPDWNLPDVPASWPRMTLGWDSDTAAARYAARFEELFIQPENKTWTSFYSPSTRVTTRGLLSSEMVGCAGPCCQCRPW